MAKYFNPKYIFTGVSFLLQLIFLRTYAQQSRFVHAFAPTDAFIKPQEKPYRDGICLNGSWSFFPIEHAETLAKEKIQNPAIPDNFKWEATPVKVPSPWNVNNFATGDGSGGDFVTYPSYPKKWESIRAGWLMRKIPYHKEWKNKRLIVHFDAVGGYTQIYINRHKAGENLEVFLPFDVDITDFIKEGQDNELLVWVADAQLFNQPGKYGRRIYVGGSFWGQHVIGMWQDVNLIVKPLVNIQNTFINPSLSTDELNVEATLTNTSSKPQEINIGGTVYPWVNLADKSNTIAAPEPKWKLGPEALALPAKIIKIAPNSSTTIQLKVKVNGKLKKWSADNPSLYGLILSANEGGHIVDKQYTRFGWRQFSIKENKFYLNGQPLVLKGDSWHFMGIPQMTRRYAWAWFDLLKKSHANAVRLHAQPYPQFYLDMADEMGICVLDETGMWASDGGPKINSEEYWKNSEIHLRRFILRDRNHPSVFGWSVCNENMPVAINVFHAPDSLVQRQVAEINKWIKITAELDPSREWISGDGESQANLNSPVIIGHYGGSDENYRSLSSKGKVWGVGEAGMAYYATPLQTSVYNGNRSFVSQQGRMEGVADESTNLINLFKKYNASFMSVFNLVWYGVKPLELGLKDTT
ncbi:MAG: glycosyl hydrolase family 2, partial [Mucilaginibacter sp.]|nr:glycosyl hydrolase family 2 [Mucilaginibacter sp.]